MARVLIVDDEAPIRQALRGILERQSYEVEEAASVGSALARIESAAPFDAALVDLRLPDGEGTAILEAARGRDMLTAVIMISGHGSIAAAVAAVRNGAYDFLEKPLDRERILITLRNATRQVALSRQAEEAAEGGLLTRSALMEGLLAEARRLAVSDAPLLITGETGAGKEVLARWVHARSPFAQGPFVAVKCAALPENLAESELFGHVKGAYTGAETARKGKFLTASGGTLFLDEVGDLTPSVQAKLLRVLEEAAVEPVGGDKAVPVHLRIVAATHRDLKAKVLDGTFREDLRFRIGGFPLTVPPLRQRPEDVPLLASHFTAMARRRQGWPVEDLAPEVLKALARYRWPGNVRELRWAVERAVLLAGPAMPSLEHLPAEVHSAGASPAPGGLEGARAGAEAEAITRALERSRGNVSLAAKALDLSRSRLYEKMEELGLDPEKYRRKKSSPQPGAKGD